MWSIIWKYSIIKNILHRNSSFKKYTINQTNCRICLWISKFYPWVVRHESVIKVAVCLQSDKYAFMVLDCFYAGLQRKTKIMLQMFKMLKNSKLRRKSVFFLIDILDFIKKKHWLLSTQSFAQFIRKAIPLLPRMDTYLVIWTKFDAVRALYNIPSLQHLL